MQLFSSFNLALKIFGAKVARKMLIKLTPILIAVNKKSREREKEKIEKERERDIK